MVWIGPVYLWPLGIAFVFSRFHGEEDAGRPTADTPKLGTKMESQIVFRLFWRQEW